MSNPFLTKVYAQDAVPQTLSDPVGVTDLGQIFAIIINLILGIGWAMVFVMLALGFVQYVMSQGDKAKVDTAQKWLTYAVIGGVGLFFVTVLRTIIPSLIGGDAGGPGGGFIAF